MQLILQTLCSKMYLLLLFPFCIIIIIIIIIIFLLKFRRLHLFERNGFNVGTHQMGQVKSIPVWWNSDIILQWLRPNNIKRSRAGQGRTIVNRRVMGLAPSFLSHCQTQNLIRGQKKCLPGIRNSKAIPLQAWWSQEPDDPRFLDIRCLKVVRLSSLRAGHI